MRLVYRCLAVIACLLSGRMLYGQSCLSNFEFSGCSNNVNLVCPTFTNSCSGWSRSFGTPEIMNYSGGVSSILFYANTAGTQGIYTAYPFIQGNNYDVMTSYDLDGNGGTQATGAVNIFAASGVTQDAVGNCQEAVPTGPSTQGMYSRSTTNQNLSVSDDIQTVTQLSAAYDQIWVYPTIGGTTQVNLNLYAVYVCPSCYAIATYSSGTLPVQVNGQDITISIPAQDVSTLVEATDAIYLQKGFSTNPTGSVTFVAEISPNCTYSNEKALIVRRIFDSASGAKLNFDNAQSPADAGSTGLRIYPTLSKGMVTLTGPVANMANADISVLNTAGQIVYQLYNVDATAVQINLGNVPNGLYIVTVRQNSKLTTRKIIISK